MPIQGGDGRPNGFLDVLGHPPIVFLLEIANGDQPGSRSNGEFVLLRTPFDASGSPVDPQQDQILLPGSIRKEVPDVSVAISGASHDPVGLGRPINAGNA